MVLTLLDGELTVTIGLGISALYVSGPTGTPFYYPSPQHIYDGGTPPPSPHPNLQVAALILILVSLT